MAQRQLELGYEGGVVLRLTVEDSVAAGVTSALSAGGWHQVIADEGEHWVNLAQLVYLRLDDAPAGIGFSGT